MQKGEHGQEVPCTASLQGLPSHACLPWAAPPGTAGTCWLLGFRGTAPLGLGERKCCQVRRRTGPSCQGRPRCSRMGLGSRLSGLWRWSVSQGPPLPCCLFSQCVSCLGHVVCHVHAAKPPSSTVDWRFDNRALLESDPNVLSSCDLNPSLVDRLF